MKIAAAAVFALLALVSSNATADCAQHGASECIRPMTGTTANPLSNAQQDVVRGPTYVADDARNAELRAHCAAYGASECIVPMRGTYSVDPYPTASLAASQVMPDVYATWLTTNAVSTTLVCTGPLGTTLNTAVSSSGTSVDIAGSNTWPAGVYTCTLTATNVNGRVAAATSTFLVAPQYATPPAQPSSGHPVLTCQDTTTWDPVAYTWTIHLSPLGRTIAAGYWAYEFTYRYTYNSVTNTYSPVPGPWPTTYLTQFRALMTIYACP